MRRLLVFCAMLAAGWACMSPAAHAASLHLGVFTSHGIGRCSPTLGYDFCPGPARVETEQPTPLGPRWRFPSHDYDNYEAEELWHERAGPVTEIKANQIPRALGTAPEGSVTSFALFETRRMPVFRGVWGDYEDVWSDEFYPFEQGYLETNVPDDAPRVGSAEFGTREEGILAVPLYTFHRREPVYSAGFWVSGNVFGDSGYGLRFVDKSECVFYCGTGQLIYDFGFRNALIQDPRAYGFTHEPFDGLVFVGFSSDDPFTEIQLYARDAYLYRHTDIGVWASDILISRQVPAAIPLPPSVSVFVAALLGLALVSRVRNRRVVMT